MAERAAALGHEIARRQNGRSRPGRPGQPEPARLREPARDDAEPNHDRHPPRRRECSWIPRCLPFLTRTAGDVDQLEVSGPDGATSTGPVSTAEPQYRGASGGRVLWYE